MSLLFVDGFDHYVTADLTKKWHILASTGSSGATITAAAGRNGSGALTNNGSTASSNSWISRTFPPAASWVIGFAFKFSGSVATPLIIAALTDAGTTQCDLRLNADSTLSVTRNGTALTSGTSATALSSGIWYYIEWKITIANSISAGSCKVRVNGSDVITVATSQDTQNTANATASQLKLGIQTTNSSTSILQFYDDVYVCDSVDSGIAGVPNNDFLGDVRAEAILPNGAGNTTGMTPSTGSNYTCVDDTTPNDDTDYVSSSVATTKDTYAFANLTTSPVTIFGVQTVLTQRKDDAGHRFTCPVTRTGATDYDGSNYAVLDSYSMDCQVRQSNPNTSAAWTEAGVNGAEFGMKVVS